MFGFEKLDVWQKSIELSDCVYALTRKFPTDERFGLTSQLRRFAVSVSSNIAEGSARASINEFVRFVEISYASLMELVTQSNIARRQGFLTAEDYQDVYERCEQIARMLSGLKASMRNHL